MANQSETKSHIIRVHMNITPSLPHSLTNIPLLSYI